VVVIAEFETEHLSVMAARRPSHDELDADA
jgi:hypothetical protein